jgi:hypothetical protein
MHKQGDCCTDGVVLGMLPSSDFRFNFKYLEVAGLVNFNIGDFDPSTNTMRFLALNFVRSA